MEKKEMYRVAPCNPNAQPCVYRVLQYLNDLQGKGIVTGQHTQTMEQKELAYIREITGKEPALCGIELLSYSPNIDYESGDEECKKEIDENRGTLEKAWEWAEKGGLITLTWHWFSPLGGWDKSFYTDKTDFDASLAVQEGTKEHTALLSDMDAMAELLRPFCEKEIPILFRPFHEGDGNWFWWGAKGFEVVKTLYRMMYERYTRVHHLDNLIWVWNAPKPEAYPGDDVVDVLTRDMYPPAHEHRDLIKEYEELKQVTEKKPLAIGEIGTLPSITLLAKNKTPLVWYMTWSKDFGSSDKFTSKEKLKEFYDCDYAVTLDKLPKLY